MLGHKLSFGKHVKKTQERAEISVAVILRLMSDAASTKDENLQGDVVVTSEKMCSKSDLRVPNDVCRGGIGRFKLGALRPSC